MAWRKIIGKKEVIIPVAILVGGGLIGIVIGYLSSNNKPGVFINLGGVAMAAGVTFLGSSIIFEWYEVHNKIEKLGIVDIQPIDPKEDLRREGYRKRDDELLNDLSNAKDEVIIAGTSCSGAFDSNFEDIWDIFFENPSIVSNVKIEVFVIHPNSDFINKRSNEEEVGGEDNRKTIKKRILRSLDNLIDVLDRVEKKGFSNNFKLYIYDATPMRVYKIDENLFVSSYLPFIPNKYCPQLKIRDKGELAEKYLEAVNYLRNNCKVYDKNKLENLVGELRLR